MIRDALILAFVASLLACGQDENPGDASLDGDQGDVADADATLEAAADASLSDRQPPTYNIVDGGGDDPICYSTDQVVRSCCNGEPCRGFCVGESDGSVSCSCYGITGGCWSSGLDCCERFRGCEDWQVCEGLPPGP